MKQAAQMLNSAQLRQFAPLGKLSDNDAQELLRTSITVQLSPGTLVFSQDDSGKQLFYLIEGKIELHSTGNKTIIEAGSKEAQQPIGRHFPIQESAIAVENSTLVSFDADLLDLFLNWTNPNAYIVNEMGNSQNHEWLNRLLKSRGLLRFSEQQINTLLERMSEVHFNKGDEVISQDGDDRDFYIIKQGHAVVSRKPTPTSKQIKLADLGEGDAFGEESILTDAPRGATVIMQESGNLMRLSKQDFSELLAQPLLETISWQEAQAMTAMGAIFLDIRQEEEFKTFHIPNSINTPLPFLRLKLKQLKQRNKYIVYCDDGSRSAVATFLLNQHGFDAYILDGGIATALPHIAMKEMANIDSAKKAGAQETTNIDTKHQPVAVAQEQKSTQIHIQDGEHCSLADYWGATVETIADESFADSDTLNNIEKTRLTPTTSDTSARKLIPNESIVFAELKQPSTISSTTTQANQLTQFRSHSVSRKLHKTILVYSAISIVVAYAMYESIPSRFVTNSSVPVAATITADTTLTTMNNQPSMTTSAPPVTFIYPAVNEPQQLSNQESPQLVTEAEQMNTPIESDSNRNDEEFLNLQPVTSLSEKKPDSLDPATRGFIE